MQADDATDSGENPRGAWRMAIIAFLGFNLAYGCFFGTLPVLLLSVEERLGATREQVTLAFMAAAIAGALLAPLVGSLANRISLRLIFLVGAGLMCAGNALLAHVDSVTMFVALHALMIGPANVICGGVLPAVIVTRWLDSGRGKALGLAHTPIILALFPVMMAQVLASAGVEAAYYTAAGAAALLFLCGLFLQDRAGHATGEAEHVSLFRSAPAVLGRPAFWALMIPAICLMAAMGMLGAHVVAIADSWGIPPQRAAIFLTVNSLAAIAGPVAFGLLSDRRGGAFSITVIALCCGALWAVMLLEPGFALMLAIIAGIGAVNGGMIPSLSAGLAQALGRDRFPTAYGLSKFVPLPLTATATPLAGLVFTQTGSYASVIGFVAVLLVLVAPIALLARSASPAASSDGIPA